MKISKDDGEEIVLLGQGLLVFIAATASFLEQRGLEKDLVEKAARFIERKYDVDVSRLESDEDESVIIEIMLLVGEMLEFNQEAIKALRFNKIGNLIIPRMELLEKDADVIAKKLSRGISVTCSEFAITTPATFFKGFSDYNVLLESYEVHAAEYLASKKS